MVATAQTEATFDALWTSYRRNLVARRRSPATIAGKDYTYRLWGAYRTAQGWPDEPASWQRAEVEQWIAHLLATKAPATAANNYRILHSFLTWLVEEEELEQSPMRRMRAPNVPLVPPAVVNADTLGRLLAAAKGRGFEERRDTALILLLASTGCRRGEAVGLHVGDVDVVQGFATVDGKSGQRTVPLTPAVCSAIDRYLRVRSAHRRAGSSALWLGHRGILTGNGCLQMVQRRAREAGVTTRLYPHLLRHGATHALLAAGVSELDVCTLLGWTSTNMLQRYGASMRSERAIASYRKLFG